MQHAIPRLAATLVLVTKATPRSASHRVNDIEVLMVRRHAGARFMPNVYVFPGGGVEKEDILLGETETSPLVPRRAALRELTEETAAVLDSDGTLHSLVDSTREERSVLHTPAVDRLAPIGRWVTPTSMKHRYDTFFYGATATSTETTVQSIALQGQESEISELVWIPPWAALHDHEDPSSPFFLPPPTYLLLHALAVQTDYDSLAARWQSLQGGEPSDYTTVTPVVEGEKGVVHRTTLPSSYFSPSALGREAVLAEGRYRYPNPLIKKHHGQVCVTIGDGGMEETLIQH